MNEGDVGAVLRETVSVTLKLAGPPLAAALAIGLVMSIVQVITQMSEQTLSFVPKVASVVVVLAVSGAFMLRTLSDFVAFILDRLVSAGGT